MDYETELILSELSENKSFCSNCTKFSPEKGNYCNLLEKKVSPKNKCISHKKIKVKLANEFNGHIRIKREKKEKRGDRNDS